MDKIKMFQEVFQNYKNNQQPNQIIDPNKINDTTKRTWINQNISNSRVGKFKDLPKYESIKVQHFNGYYSKADSICKVSVIHEHCLDVVTNYVDIGTNNFTKKNNKNPVVLNVVGRDFTGDNFESSEEIRDQMMNIRTTFCSNTYRKNPFPINEKECVYTPLVNIVRAKNPNILLQNQNIFRTSFITTCPIFQNKLIKKMSSEDLIKTFIIIESVFQVAIGNDHEVLILTPFGHTDDNNPIDDIILIYNFCILQYGHKFKEIIIAIPPWFPVELFEIYDTSIVKPNELVKTIDDKYDEMEESNNIEEKFIKKTKNI